MDLTTIKTSLFLQKKDNNKNNKKEKRKENKK